MEIIYTSFLIGLGLAMDCLAVSFAAGAREKKTKLKAALVLAIFFGGFQTGMTLAGWFFGTGFTDFISSYDHWIASSLLIIIGLKMCREGLEEECPEKEPDIFHIFSVLTLAVATSIDALAVGISFAFLKVSPIIPALIIGLVTAVVSVGGVYAGGKAGHILGRRVDILGGIILILIGFHIILEHTGYL